jgi:uncharacterized protein YjcR
MTKIEEFNKAKVLYVEHGLTYTAISKQLVISEKQLSRWSKRYGWKEERESMLKGIITINDFIKSLQAKHPMLSVQFQMYADDYFTSKR